MRDPVAKRAVRSARTGCIHATYSAWRRHHCKECGLSLPHGRRTLVQSRRSGQEIRIDHRGHDRAREQIVLDRHSGETAVDSTTTDPRSRMGFFESFFKTAYN